MATLPPASSLRSLPDESINQILSVLFEPSPSLTSLLLPLIRHDTSITTYTDLANLARKTLLSLATTDPVLLEILSAHPRLGAKKVESAQSQAEQRSLGGEEERERLARLNEEYEEHFPGLRYVVFVNGRSRDEIMEDMRRRLDSGTQEGEVRAASDAMCDIAVDRAAKLGQK